MGTSVLYRNEWATVMDTYVKFELLYTKNDSVHRRSVSLTTGYFLQYIQYSYLNS